MMTFANPSLDLPPIVRLEEACISGFLGVLIPRSNFVLLDIPRLDHILPGSLHLPHGSGDSKKFG